MSASPLAWLASVLILAGTLFCLIGAIGVLRLPDCYTRMHAASKAGALGAAMVLGGVAAATSGEAALEVMERHLLNRPFFVGESMTIADIALYAYTHAAEDGGFDLSRYPAIRLWLGRVAGDPGHVPMLPEGYVPERL